MDCPKCGAGDYYASIFGGRNLCVNPECEDARPGAMAAPAPFTVTTHMVDLSNSDDCEECGADPGECDVDCGQWEAPSLEELVEQHGIQCDAVLGANHEPPPVDWGHMISYRVTLTRHEDGEDYELAVDFHVGTAHGAPDACDVLNCLVQDAMSVEWAGSFEAWAENMGYDSDSRRAEKIYNDVVEQAVEIREFLGDHFYEFSTAEY